MPILTWQRINLCIYLLNVQFLLFFCFGSSGFCIISCNGCSRTLIKGFFLITTAANYNSSLNKYLRDGIQAFVVNLLISLPAIIFLSLPHPLGLHHTVIPHRAYSLGTKHLPFCLLVLIILVFHFTHAHSPFLL